MFGWENGVVNEPLAVQLQFVNFFRADRPSGWREMRTMRGPLKAIAKRRERAVKEEKKAKAK